MKLRAVLFIGIVLMTSASFADPIRIVDKDRHDFGVEASVGDRNTLARITSSDQKGIVSDASVFRTNRLVQISAVDPSSYYIKKLDCPFSGSIIEMQSVDGIRTLAANAFGLAAKSDPAAALAFSELAARTVEIDPDYSEMARRRSLEVSIKPITDAVTLEALNKVLLDNKVVQKALLDKSEVNASWFISKNSVNTRSVINNTFSQLIQKYQVVEIRDAKYQLGQLDHTTLRSFSDFATSEILFKKLTATVWTDPTISMPNGATH